MTNSALRAAIADAGVGPRQLAYRVGVSVKQVERWLADGQLVPYVRNRDDAAQVLGVSEEMIWPGKPGKSRIKGGRDRELVRSYPYRSGCPSTVWTELIESAQSDIFLAGYTNYFFWTQHPQFADTLRQKTQEGCRVRFLVGDPDGETTGRREAVESVALSLSARIRTTLRELGKLGPLEGLETRFSSPEDAPSHVPLSVFRFDSTALVTPHLARTAGHDSPLLHLSRQGDGGLFDRFSEHAEELWSRGVRAVAAT